MPKYLVRIYHINKDKQNESVSTLEQALILLGKSESDIYNRVNWLQYTDLFFRDTNNYIRVDNSAK
jgi:uncharacterized protein Smg (DUF494 family)